MDPSAISSGRDGRGSAPGAMMSPLERRVLLSAVAGIATDLTFGQAGRVVTDLALATNGRTDALQDARLTGDGKPLLTGTNEDSGLGIGSDRLTVVRYLTDGTFDPSFGTGGVFTFDNGGVGNVGVTSVPLADGRTLLAGWSHDYVASTDYPHTFVIRIDASGSLDPTFGTEGVVRLGDGEP